MLETLCSFAFLVVCWGWIWEGFYLVFFDVIICLLGVLIVLRDFHGDVFWQHSPLDREEVAMLGERALIGPQ